METSEVTSRVNSRTAKFLALIIVSGFIIYHGIIHLTSGIDSCKWLLSDGRFQSYAIWQPYGCLMHSYSYSDSKRCMRYIAYWGGKTYIVFVGDSRIRQLFSAFVQQIDPTYEFQGGPIHHGLNFTDSDLKLTIDFLWQPMVNESMVNVYENWLCDECKGPSLVVTGSATWAIKASNASLHVLESYKRNLTELVPILNRMNPSTKVLWVLQDPVVPEKLDHDHQMITNEQIDMYNKAAMECLRYSHIHIWSSSRLVSQGLYQEQTDGLHMGKSALHYAVQILLNMYCNDHMNYNDGTCCSSPEPITTLQVITFSILGVSGCIGFAMFVHKKCFLRNSNVLITRNGIGKMTYGSLGVSDVFSLVHSNFENSNYELCTALGRLGLIMAYFFLCDRTNFFMKENKYYTNTNFILPVLYFFVLGVFLTEDSKYTQVLHRDQTNEWKGWMQLGILIYHVTGASQILPIYVHIRVLVAAYLFLSGYGHFTYLYQTGDFGIQRFWKVVFRLNMLVVVLCLCMNRPYQFYYFVPLVTFWFFIVFATMASPPRVTSSASEVNPLQYLYIVMKFVILFGVVTVLYVSEVFFEKIFVTRPWKALFVTIDDSIKEWWFRWRVDRYSVGFGMLFAFAHQTLKQYHVLDDKNYDNLFSKNITIFVSFIAAIGIGSYTVFAFLCGNKLQCNEVHPYISFIPILSYITLRNVSGYLRTKYSIFFAWFGKISLELFIAQYHIWLAADSHGVLVFVPGYPVLNVMVTSFIFVCIAHEIHSLSDILVNYAVPSDCRYLTRNLTIFFLILIPIGIHDGMF